MELDTGLTLLSSIVRNAGRRRSKVVGKKLLRCSACGFELYLNVAAAVAGVIVDEQERMVVLVRGKEPGKGQWDLPGGFVDPEDTAEEAMRREVREEIGLEVTGLTYLGSWPNVYEYRGCAIGRWIWDSCARRRRSHGQAEGRRDRGSLVPAAGPDRFWTLRLSLRGHDRRHLPGAGAIREQEKVRRAEAGREGHCRLLTFSPSHAPNIRRRRDLRMLCHGGHRQGKVPE